MMRTAGLAAILVVMSAITSQAATIVGSQAIGDFGSPVTDTGNILTATTFDFSGSLAAATTSRSGDFTALSGALMLTFSQPVLDITNPAGWTFSNPVLGSFTAQSISLESIGATQIGYYILGTFTPGSGLSSYEAGAASFSISFTQVGGRNGAISDSGTLTSPPTPPQTVTPEPTSTALAGFAGIGMAIGAWRRRRQERPQAA